MSGGVRAGHACTPHLAGHGLVELLASELARSAEERGYELHMHGGP